MTKEKLSIKQEHLPITNILLGEVMLSSSRITYKVIVEVSRFKMEWYATVVKNEKIKYVSDVWCADKYKEEYKKLKKSVKKKIRKMVEDVVTNIP
jgi:hypothetical protein